VQRMERGEATGREGYIERGRGVFVRVKEIKKERERERERRDLVSTMPNYSIIFR
jgi:hypothetical protein